MSLSHPETVEDLLNYRLDLLLASSSSMIVRLCEGRYGITRREWRLICLLKTNGPMSPSVLSAASHLGRARVSRHVSDMVSKKLLVRTSHESDKRRAQLTLSARGHKLYADLFPQTVGFNNRILAALTDSELELFDRGLAKLSAAAEQLSLSHPVAEKADRRHGRRGRRTDEESAPALDLSSWRKPKV